MGTNGFEGQVLGRQHFRRNRALQTPASALLHGGGHAEGSCPSGPASNNVPRLPERSGARRILRQDPARLSQRPLHKHTIEGLDKGERRLTSPSGSGWARPGRRAGSERGSWPPTESPTPRQTTRDDSASGAQDLLDGVGFGCVRSKVRDWRGEIGFRGLEDALRTELVGVGTSEELQNMLIRVRSCG